MRKVKNKKVIRLLSARELKADKKKNSIVVLAIMLTCILFTALFSIGGSMLKSSQESTMRQVGGRSMAGLKLVLPRDYEKISSDKAVKKCFYRIAAGEGVNDKLSKLNTEVNYAQDAEAENMFCYPEEGRMPEKRLEAATSTLVLDALDIPHKIGAKIPMKISVDGKIVTETFTLCGFWEGDPVSMAQQFWISRAFCDEIAPTPEQPYGDSDQMKMAGYWLVDFSYANSWNIEGKTQELLQRNGYDPETTRYGTNWAYAASEVDFTTVLLVAVLLAIILLSGYLIIYNVFYLRVSKDMRHYGLLKTIGTTGRQLKRLVRIQACRLAVLGIPMGLILGTLLSRALLPVIVNNFELGGMAFSLSPLIYIAAALFSFVTVLISCMRPARLAAKVSPVEAVNYTEPLAIKKKRKKSRKTTVFSMAKANLGRSKRKVVIVVASLALSMTLLNATFAIVSGFDVDEYVSNSIIGDFMITDVSVANPGRASVLQIDSVDQEAASFFSSIDGVERVSPVYCAFSDIKMDKRGAKTIEKFVAENPGVFGDEFMKSELDYVRDNGLLQCRLYGMDQYGTDRLKIKEGNVDWKKFQSGNYIVLEKVIANTGANTAEKNYCSVGDKISLKLPDGKVKQYEVMAIVEIPYAMTCRASSALETQVVLPEAEYLAHAQSKGALHSILTVSEDKGKSVDQVLEAYTEKERPELAYSSKQKYVDEFSSFTRMFTIVGSALSGILALIGILNFANVIITSILARQQEFAMMQAVGMTGNQLKGILIWEGLLYALITLIVTATLGSLLCRGVVQAIAGQIWFFHYHFTLVPILLCVPAVLLVTWLIPVLVYGSMSKKTVVERLKVFV